MQRLSPGFPKYWANKNGGGKFLQYGIEIGFEDQFILPASHRDDDATTFPAQISTWGFKTRMNEIWIFIAFPLNLEWLHFSGVLFEIAFTYCIEFSREKKSIWI
jgi:hypothetical protein